LRVKTPARYGVLMSWLAGGIFALSTLVAFPALAADVKVAVVEPAQLTPKLAADRLRPSYSQPELTNNLLQAYVQRQQQLKTFNAFGAEPTELSSDLLLGYIDRTEASNGALDAIDSAAGGPSPTLTNDMLANYAQHQFLSTELKVEKVQQKRQLSAKERLCLTQAIYHEARGESVKGQWAVANVIINRAMSHKFPTTLCGVVFQNADLGYHRCQFTFACDGRSDLGREHGAWTKAEELAEAAYDEYAGGERPGIVPANALFYHTTAVRPNWGGMHSVATIGSHIFYAKN
jgi:spore germination cell wall hydrolase CwlJ-like protein